MGKFTLKRTYEVYKVKSSSGMMPYQETTLEPVNHKGVTFNTEYDAEQWLHDNGERLSQYIILEILTPE